jgi:hypothetical protein
MTTPRDKLALIDGRLVYNYDNVAPMPLWLRHVSRAINVLMHAVPALVLVIAVLWVSFARADFLLTTPGGGSFIFRDNLGSAEPHIINVPEPLSEEARARVKAWEDACVAGLRAGDYGVDYYVYKRVGCEYGRTNGRLK